MKDFKECKYYKESARVKECVHSCASVECCVLDCKKEECNQERESGFIGKCPIIKDRILWFVLIGNKKG